MMELFLKLSVLIVVMAGLFLWGMLTIRNQVFPFEIVRSLVGIKDVNESVILAKARSFDLFSRDVDIVFIGDSLTEAVQWQDMFPSKKVANRGIASDTTKGILKRLDSILSTTPEKAFIMVGFNDLNGGEKVENVFARYKEIVRSLENEGIMVVIQSTLDCADGACRVRRQIKKLNENLRTFAKNNNNIWIDINIGLSPNNGGLKSKYTYDGIHLNGDGYLVWKEQIRDAVISQ